MDTKELFRSWYMKLLLHVAGAVGLTFLPITLPISIGIVIWVRCTNGKHVAAAIWSYMLSCIKFAFDHNVDRFCDDFDVYEKKMDRALNL